MTGKSFSTKYSFLRSFFSFLMILGLLVPSAFAFAQNIDEQEAKLRAEYAELEKEIAQWQKVLNDTRAKATTIQGDISYLNAKIKEAELTIQAKNNAIRRISGEINEKNAKIQDLDQRIVKGKESLAQILRKTNEIDEYSLVELILGNRDLSEFFDDLDVFTSIKKALQVHFTLVREARAATESEKQILGQKKNEEADARYVVETQKKEVAKTQNEKKELLAITKSEEASYQQVLAERQQRAAQIRAALFRLRDTEGIPFGQALEYAKSAEKLTGVRAALILAILTQESDLGRNQGSCLLSNIETGDGVGKNTGTPFEKVMKPGRDTEPFASITKRLGRDWKMTPVSCPPGYTWTASRGYGGGMGPAQFIPSTWELFKARIGATVGVPADLANPWDPAHAFVASALYMKDLGAGAGGYTAERNAACRYYSGAACQPGRSPANVFYGDQVMQKAEEIQGNIDFLNEV